MIISKVLMQLFCHYFLIEYKNVVTYGILGLESHMSGAAVRPESQIHQLS